NGITDIKNKVMRTVRESARVFGEDGLRLLRLARQSGQLGFSPSEETLQGAKENAALIHDIAPERIFTELNAILFADKKYGEKDGAYHALTVLQETGVLKEILPELALGDGMPQRADFHKYTVLEHSLRCVLYAAETIRWAALLHDIGKPFCMLRDGNFHAHPEEGAKIVDAVLTRLKAPKKLIESTHALIEEHMYDLNGQTGERKLRRYLVTNYHLLPDLLALKQADFSACKDDENTCPTKLRWEGLLQKMQQEGVPFTLKELDISGKDLLQAGIAEEYIGKVLNGLFLECANEPKKNKREVLLQTAHAVYKNLLLNGKRGGRTD
ncbi:MAG: HD domain-containing protein, partial [Clostridia bacterium]|nr:HD domain-containing protein [Clostridia bacterium]